MSVFPNCTSHFPIAMQDMILISGATFLSIDLPELQRQPWLRNSSTFGALSSRLKIMLTRYYTIAALFASLMNL